VLKSIYFSHIELRDSAMAEKQPYQNRTAIVHIGSTKKEYLSFIQSEDHQPLIQHLQAPLKAQLSAERHKSECLDTGRYTLHSTRNRQLQGWRLRTRNPTDLSGTVSKLSRRLHGIAKLYPALSSSRCGLPGKVTGNESGDGLEQ
jgi:hypothetical protein